MRRTIRSGLVTDLVLTRLLPMLALVLIQLGLFRTPALASAWQVYYCDPNTGTSMVEATLVDDTNNRELRGDYDSWYVVDADSSPDDDGRALYKATEDDTVEVYGDVNVIITDNTRWLVERIHLNNGAKLTIWSETGNKTSQGQLSAKTTSDHVASISVGEGATLVINGCYIHAETDTDDAAGIGGDKGMSAGTITINDGEVFASSKMNAAGIGAGKRGANGGNITINGGSVTGSAHDEDGAGIGGGEGGEGGNITINGGNVVAYGAEAASGIGGGCYSSAGNVTINGGKVKASGGEDGAGIGGGDEGSAGNITINGGTIEATGGEHGAGIGCGCDAYEKNADSLITITGGNITATGGESGAGIGSGYETNSHIINITGNGTIVEATGGKDAAGIGGGEEGRGGTITIADATVNATGMRRAAGIGGGCGYGFDTIDITNAKIRAVAVFGAGIGVSGSKLFDDDAKVLKGGNISITNSTTFAASVAGGAGIGGGVFARADSITIRGGTTIAQGGSSYVHKKEVTIYGADQLNEMLSAVFSEGFSVDIPDEVTDALGFIVGGFIFGDEVGDFLGDVVGGVVNEIASWFGGGSDKGDTIYYAGAGIGCGHGADGGTINILDRAYVQAYDGRTDHDEYKYSFAIGSGKFKDNNTAITIYDEAMVTHGKMDPIGGNKFTPVKLGVTTARAATDNPSGILRDRELAQYAVIEPGAFEVPVVKEWGSSLAVPSEVSVSYNNTYYLDSTTNASDKSETAAGSFQLSKLKDWRGSVRLRPQGTVSLSEATANGAFGGDWEQSWRLQIHYEKPITRYDEKGNLQSIDTDRYDFAVKPTRVMQDDNGSWSVFSFQRREDAQLPNGNYISEDMYNAMMEALMAEDGSATFVLTNTHRKTYSVQKNWHVDDAGQYRPESVDVVLQQKQSDGTWKTLQTKTLNDANEWKTSFDAVSDLGDSNYRIRETYNDGIVYNKGDLDIADGATQVNTYTYKGLQIGGKATDVAYDVTYETDAKGLTTITNRWRRPDTITVHGRKIWVDNKNSGKTRPTELNVYLMADGAVVRSQVIKPDDKGLWGWTFDNLPSTNSEGKAIAYTVTEDVPDGYTGVAAGKRLENVKIEDGSSEAEPADGEHIEVQGYDLANVPTNSPGVGPVDPGDDPDDPGVNPDDPDDDDDDDDHKPIVPIVPIVPVPPVPPVPPAPLPDLPGAPEEEVNEEDEDKDEDEDNNEKVNIKVTKSWDDDNDKAKKRPTSVKVKLLADGIVKQTTTLNAANNWTHTFENQPKKVSKESQVSIVYTVTEDPVNKYTTRIERDDIQGLSSGNTCYKITNTYEDNSEKETYSVKKVWNIDAAGQDRPSVLKAVLQKQTSLITWETAKGENGQECVVDLTAANNWEAEFPAVKKKEDGKTIKYRIRELDKDGDTVYARGDHDYQKYINKYFNEYVLRRMSALDSLTVLDCGDHLSEYLVKYAESGTRTTITNTAVMEIGIKKFWLGADKPADDADIWNSIYLMLMSRPKAAAGGESVPYTPVYNALFGDALDGDAALNQVAGFFNAESVLSVLTMATGFHASDYINYGLAAAKATKDNGWQVKFGVPKYDALGQEQEYMGAEVVTGILSMAVKGVTGIDTPVMIRPIDPKFVSVFGSAIQVPVLNKDYQRSCYVINTWLDLDGDPGDPDVVLGGVKYWDDGDATDRPSEVVLHAYARQDDGSKKEVKGSPITVKASDGWAWSLPLTKADLGLQEDDVIDPAIFSIEEDVPGGYDASYSGFDVINKKKGSGDPESETRDIVVTKHWDDGNNKDGIRPANVRITIKANDKVVKNVVLDQSNNWTTTVTALPKKDAAGNDIDYKLEEEKTDVLTGTDSPWTYKIDVSGNADAGFTIKNKHTPADTDSQKKIVTVKKVWDDNNNQDGLRPSYVKVALKATYDGTTTTVKTVALDELNNWQETVANLPTKWGGKQITYAWDEVVPSGYTSAQSNDGDTTTITNTHTPETISVGVRKIWKDNNDEAKKRPTTLAVTLYADGVATDKTLTLSNTASDNVAAWCGIVDNLPKYKGGKEIQYIWAENEEALPEGYTLTKTSVSGGVTTLTNTYNATSTSTSVRKVWDDNGDTAVKRPDYVVMALYRTYNGERESAPIKRLRLRADSGWKATVSNLPMLYSDNTPVGYEWVEEPFDNGYELANTVVSGNVTTFTNAAKRSVTVSKVWKDENNFDGIRPSSVTVNLYANGTATGKSLTLDESNGWYGSFGDLAATKDGATIAYTVAEQKTSTIAGKDGVGTYSSTVSGTADSGFTITNVHTPQKTSVDVTKEWDDNNNQDGKRPANVTVRLLANGMEVRQATVAPASDGTWSYTFADLPMYQGTSKIDYTVAENDVEGYTAKVSGNATDGFTIKNTHKPEATAVSVNKVWEDANDQDGKRPNSVTVKLSAKVGDAPVTSVDGKPLKLKADDGWSGKFADLPKYQGGKEVTYTVTENKVEGYNDPQVTGSAADGFTITNTHMPETRDVAVTKVWDHGNNAQNARPTSVTIKLMADGVVKKTVQLSGTGSGTVEDVEYGQWTATFKGLPKYSGGREVNYTVSEDAIDNYATSVTGNQNKGFTFTNTYTPGKTQVSVHKVWDDANDQDGIRPSSVEVALYKEGEDDSSRSVTLNAANGWSGTFAGLDAEGTYSVEEEDLPDGYTSKVAPQNSADGSRDFTITNTHTPQTTSVKVSKVWYSDTEDGRPEEVTIRLYANGTEVKIEKLTKAGGWTHTFEELPVYEDGSRIAYTVSEDAVTNYTSTVTGNATQGFNIANTYSTDYTSVRVIKRWDDANNQDGSRPSNVEVRLVADGKETAQVLRLSAANGWSGTFGGLPAKDANNNPISYTVTEQAVPGYATTYEGGAASGFIVANKHTPEKTSVSVTKNWDDKNDQDGVRPDSVTVYLLANGERTGQSMELSKSNGWKGTFANLATGKEGAAIRYSVEEEAVAGYTSATSYSEADGYTITNTHVPQTVDVSGTKTWVGDNDTNTRPESITIKLLADGGQAKDASGNDVASKTIGASDSWKWTFKDLPKYDGVDKTGKPKEITYTVSEDEVTGYETTYDRKHLNVTNTYVPTTSVKVEKEWDDTGVSGTVQHPKVTVRLYADGTQVASYEVEAGKGNWNHTFTNLPTKKNGVDVVYTVSEDAVENYTTAITGNQNKGFTVTNKYSTEGKTQVSVRKVWDDDNDRDRKRPESVTVTLKKGTDAAGTATLNAANQWSHTFVDLDATSTYTVSENAVADYETAITGDDSQGFTITNKHTPAIVNVSGTKEWADNNNQDDLRPSSIIVNLLAGGTKIDDAEVKPDSSGNWTWNFDNLPKYQGGNEITYTVTENNVPGYTTTYHASDGSAVDGGAPNGGTITNTHDPEKTSVKVTKKWDDDNNRDNLRPASVTVRLQKNGSDTGNTATLSASSNWTHTFIDLPVREGGKDVAYTVTEEAVSGYTYVISGTAAKGYVITNTHKPATVNVSGTKEWNDADNQDGIRPSSITIRLLANGEEVDHKVVRPDANGNWSWTFADVPENDVDTHGPIAYTVEEQTTSVITGEDGVGTYATSGAGSANNGYTITNTHTPETRDVAVTKVWDDGNNAARPASVTVKLMADGVVKKTVQLSSAGSNTIDGVQYGAWTATFKNLPKYNGGHEIVYTVAEDAIEDYITSVTGNQNSGFTITNTYDEGKAQVSVHKVWNDADDQDGIRPTEVEVALKNGDSEVAKQKLNAGNGWSATFSELDGGQTYRVEEPGIHDGYSSSVTPASSAEGMDFTITNTHASEKMNIVINKAWADGTAQAESVTVHLYANGRLVSGGTQTLSASNEWKYTFTDMPIKENGEEIAYAVTEDAVAGYTTTVKSATSTSGATTTKTFTVTNKATTGDNKTQVNVVKRWDDANNQDGIRPNSVAVRLLADGKATANTLILRADNNWSGTFQNLAVTASNGKNIAYTVVEQPVLGYAATYSGDAATGFAIVNAHTPQKTSVSVTKEWDDANNQDGKRPSSITVYLLADGVRTGQSIELRASNNWKGAFNNLAANKAGKSIAYTVEEEKTSVLTGTDGPGTYATSTSGNATEGYTITNKHTPETTSISGTKEWVDANNQDGLRPRTITVRLKANGTEVASQTVTASTADEQGRWAWTFADVPKYANGSEINYTVAEDAVEGYTTAIDGFTITNTHEATTVDVSGKKVWNDNNDQDGIRPGSITIRLLANGEEVDHKVVRPDASGAWSWTFSRVPKADASGNSITYTVTEDRAEGYGVPDITGSAKDGFTVTNTHTPVTRTVQVTKVWDHAGNEGTRPGSVTVRLYADGQSTGDPLELNAGNGWSGTFSDLPKYQDGREVVYTVSEDAVANYATTVEGNQNKGFSITNRYEQGKTQVNVHKVWDDANDRDGIRPETVTVKLLAGDADTGKTLSLSAGNGWSGTFDGLETGKAYTVSEDNVPTGYTSSVTGIANEGYTITNKHTPETTSVKVSKTWSDDDGATRPGSVTVRLYANGAQLCTRELSDTNGWTHTFAGLPTHQDGAEVTYTVTEDAVEGYTTAITGNAKDGFTVTNTATAGPKKTQVSVTKHWNDANNQDGVRPGSVVVNLWADGSNTNKTLQLRADNGWSGTFDGLDVTASDGAPIAYTVTEQPIPGYATTYGGDATQGFTISNSYTPQKTSVTVAKQWNDENDQDGFRPDSVTVHLLADGMRTGKTLELSAANNWSGTFGDLARRKAGADIAYTVEEETTDVITGKDAAGTYKYDVTGTAADGYTITNTHTPEVVNVSGTKTWDDADNQDGKRPASIRLRLIADGSQVATKDAKPAKDGGWTWNFGDWPKYKDGREIDYRISEDGVSGYTTTYDKFNVTNAHTPEITSVSVKKAWNDDNNRDGKRPERVTVRLSAKVGDATVEGVDGREATLEKSHNWSYTFDNLPKYQGGKEITYTVSEPNAPAGYTAGEATGDAATGFTITNTHTPERTDILIKKVWVDEGNADKRPDAVTFRLYANGAESKTVTRTLSDWDGTVSMRNYKYAGGREIVYTLTEDTVNGYKTEVARTKSDNTTNFTVTNTYFPTRTQVNVHKVWDDDNNRDGKRPTSVTVKLLADGSETGETLTLNAGGGWSGTFSELEVGKEYTVAENTVTDYKAPVVTGTAEQGFTITNKRTPETVNVSGLKTWADNNNQDGKRPNSVTIRVYADGEEVASKQFDASSASSTSTNTWNWSFDNLPKYDGGRQIDYTVTEDAVADYTTTINGFNITNTHTPEKTVVVGSKIWNDGNNRAGKRPAFIRVTLHASPAELATTLGQSEWTKEVRASDNWRWEWKDLPKYQAGQLITYTMTEEAVENYTTTYAGPFVINTYAEGKTSVSVTKRWDDANNQDGIRPNEVVVSLYANGRYTGKVLRLHAAGGWAGAFGDLDAKDGSGKDITYTVRERAVDGYTTTYDGNAKTGFVITNRHTPETTNISVRKVWDDDNNAENKRPDLVRARLLVNGVWTGQVCELKAETGWSGTFTGVPKYHAGEEAEYSINEQLTDRILNTNTPNTYNYTVEGNATDGFTITNTLVPETVSIVGAKTWDDQGHEDKRPESITVRLFANGREVASQEVKPTENGAWNYGFYNQPKREAGAEIVYTVSEDAVPDYTAHYTTTTSGYNITNSYTEGTTQVSVRKVWDDENNRDGKRPGSVTVSLKNGSTTVGTATLKADNQWSCTFDVPDTAGTYTVEESGVPADYTSSVAGDAERGFTITNTHTPSKTEKIIPVTVICDDAHDQDGLRGEVFPTKVPVTNGGADTGIAVDVNGGLTKDGAYDKWTGSFTYDAYSNEDLSGLQLVPTTSENYSVEVTGSATEQTGFTITYKHEPQTTQVQVNKVWDDNNDAAQKRPASVTVRLYADGAPAKDASDQALTATMTANKWSAPFTGLPKYRAGKEIDYTISEDAVDNYASVISGPELSDGVSKYRVYTVTNTYTEGKTQVNVRKVWDDDNDRDGIRPSSVTVKLKEGDKVTDSTLTLSEANGWAGAFTGLDATKSYGVEEEQVTGYEQQPNGAGGRDFTITNKHTPENVKVVVNKVWKDVATPTGSVTIRLYANGKEIGAQTLPTTDGKWTHDFGSLPKYENGAETVYTVTEDVIDGYDSVVASTTEEGGGTTTKTFTVTNLAHTEDNKTQVNVTKRWDDANNQDGIRPNMVNVRLLANGEETDKVLRLSAANSWAGSFRGLDATTSDGEAIDYTVAEDAVDGYGASVTGDVTAGYVVTNTHVPETVEVAGSKTWDDNDDAEGARPLSITIRLRANGTEVANRTVTAADGWAWSFAGLPSYKNGVRIQYTIAEDAVRDYSSHIAGYDAVNTYAPGKTQVQVHHIWDDEDNACGLRTNHVVVHLYANGVDTGRTLVLGEWPSLRTTSNDAQNDPWSGTFENLDLNDENGRPIVYTVREGEVPHYTNSQSGNASQGFMLVDKHDPETITLRGTKTWDDNGNEDGSRPTGVLIRLFADGVEDTSRAVYLTGERAVDPDKWTWEIAGLQRYYGLNEDGAEHEIEYTISEDAVSNYSATVSGPTTAADGSKSYALTNTHEPWTTDVRVVKVWNDDENRDGIRPAEVRVRLLANGKETGRSVTLNEASHWEGLFDRLSTKNGVVYTVEEEKTPVITGTDGTGTYAISTVGDAERGFTITNTHTPDTVTIAGTKVWDDASNQDGLRPRSVRIELLANGERVDGRVVSAPREDGDAASADTWSWEFANKPKYENGQEIAYTVSEEPVEHYDTLVTGNATSGFTITNTHVPGVRNVEGYKLWVDENDQDGVRPRSVTVRLLADGKEVASRTLTAGDRGINANVWDYSFRNVPVWNDGHEIEYTVTEDAVEGYETNYVGLNITNTHVPETVDVTVRKDWTGDAGNEAARQQQVVYVQLRANNRVVRSCELSEANDWTYTFAGVPKNAGGRQISYTVSENVVDDYTSSVTGNAQVGYTITNAYTPGLTQVNVYKVWDDDYDRDRVRPSAITVQLMRQEGENMVPVDGKVLELNESNGWAGTFDQLPIYDEQEGGTQGAHIRYAVQESSVDGYQLQTTGNMQEGFSLVNRHAPDLVSVLGSKTWVDNDNAAGLRPESIRIRLRANGTDVNGMSVDASDDWTWDFTDLPKFEAGQEIAYSIAEDAVAGYETTYEGNNVTNTYRPDITSTKVTKVWNDSSNVDGVRPESVTVRLYADSVDTGLAFTLSAANKTDDNTWVLEVNDLSLPATKDGHVISYVLVEDAVAGYTSSVTGDIATGFSVTNTHEPAPKPSPDPMYYTITYDLNGGSYNGSTDNIVETYPGGTEIRIHEAPTREGYTFDYWKGSAYQPGDAYTVTEDHTFVAQWKREGGDVPTPDNTTPNNTNASSGSADSATATPAASAGRTTASSSLARTGDEPMLALVGVATALLGVSTLALARRRR